MRLGAEVQQQQNWDRIHCNSVKESHRHRSTVPQVLHPQQPASSFNLCQAFSMREDISSSKLLLLPRNTEKKEKKKKRRKQRAGTGTRGHPSTLLTSQEKPQTTALLHETSPVSLLPPPCPGQLRGQLPKVRACSRKDGEKALGGGRRSKKQPKGSTVLSTGTNKSSSSGAPSQGDVAQLSAQARESLRWEGVLEDPQAEEKRLELYRANRRQRYLTHRQETQAALRQTFPKEDTEEKTLPNSDQ